MVTHILEVHTCNKGLTRKIPVVQTDSGRVVKCVVTDMQLSTITRARIYAKKPSGMEIYNDCTIDGNNVLIGLTTQILAEVGETHCQIELSKNTEKVTTFEFLLVVDKSLSSDTAVESSNEYTALESIILNANNAIDDCGRATDQANTAAGKADTAASAANRAAGKADTAASAANRAAGDASTAAGAANTAAEAANATVEPAENATEAANTAAEAANEAAKKAEAAAGGEISERTVTFQEAAERANIKSGDTLAVAFGKLAKYCTDLKLHAFSAPVDNLTSSRNDLSLAASMGKELKSGLDELNTNTLVTGTFSECWFPGFAIDGMGFSVIIPKHYKSHILTVSSAKIFVPVSATWVPTTVSSITELVNCWRVILTTDASMKLTNGSTYIANLGGQIK